MKPKGYTSADGKADVVPMGKEKAFDYFFGQFYAALCFFANSIIHDEDEAKDLVQECYIKLWNSQTIKERADTVKSFLYTAVHNRCLDLLRKKKVIKKAGLQLIKSNSDTDFGYFDEVAFAEMMRKITKHIEELPLKMQQVVKLYYIEGKKYKQIAGELNSTQEAVRKHKDRALKIIRHKFLLLLTLF